MCYFVTKMILGNKGAGDMDEMVLFKCLLERELLFMYFPSDVFEELWCLILDDINRKV